MDVLALAPPSDEPERPLSGLRIAFLPPPPWFGVHDDVLDAHHRLADALAPHAQAVAWRAPDLPGGVAGLYETFMRMMAALGARLTPRAEREEFAALLRTSPDPRDLAWAQGLFATAADRAAWGARRRVLRAALGSFFDHWDILVAPAVTVPAFRHAPGHAADWFSVLDLGGGRMGRYNDLFLPAALAALPGLPATVFPAGTTPTGLPVGLQALTRAGADRTTIAFAAELAAIIGGFQPPPLPVPGG
ncbi:amidase family protein [Dactylosporangium sp. NPDC051484]|uniref:amidase family protein n=1 Tax=Dactylosporangium sp. NPDC051484 TaxID=3154942 RepID=UPI00344E6073